MQNKVKYNPYIHHRRSIRLKGYDYTQAGLYFITICVKNRECLFGEIENGKMILNDAGKIANNYWVAIQDHFSTVKILEFVMMPNHLHGILMIDDKSVDERFVGARHAVPLHDQSNPHSHNAVPLHDQSNPHSHNAVPLHDQSNPHSHNAVPLHDQSNSHSHNAVPLHNQSNSNSHNTVPQQYIPQHNTYKTEQYGRPVPGSIPTIIRSYKSAVTKKINEMNNTPGLKLWQRNYWEHIIRNEKSYYRISEYIKNNPLNWQEDKYYA